MLSRERPLLVTPDCSIEADRVGPAERVAGTLMVLGGRRPDPVWLSRLAGENSFDVWGVDHGVDWCRDAGLPPRSVVGDMDSASPEGIRWAREEGASEVRYERDKDRTDFQLALALYVAEAARSSDLLVVSGCFGGRADHLFSAMHSLAFHGRGSASGIRYRCMLDDREGLFFLEGGDEMVFFFREPPFALSLLAFSDECRGVRIGGGVRWPLEDALLKRSSPWAISNRTIEPSGDVRIEVRCAEGILGLYWVKEKGEESGSSPS